MLRKILKKTLKLCGIFVLVFLLLFSGWPNQSVSDAQAAAFDAKVGASGTSKSSTNSLVHAANVIIVISVAYAGTTSPSSVTVGGTTATSLAKISQGANVSNEIFYYFASGAATDSITVTFAANTRHAWDAASYTGIKNSSSAFENITSNTGSVTSGQPSTVTVPAGTVGRLVVGGVAAIDNANGTGSITIAPANGETERAEHDLAGGSSAKSLSSQVQDFSSQTSHASNATLTKSGRTINWATIGFGLVPTTLPTATTQAATNIFDSIATANGSLADNGGSIVDKEGFVYDTSTKSLPANVTPALSGYASSFENSGTFGVGAFTVGLSGLSGGTTYYGRAYTHNSVGYSYGNEVSFTTSTISITISNGVVDYGYVAPGSSRDTTSSSLNNTQVVTNNGNVAEDFAISGQNSANWVLGATPGSEQYVHEFSTNGGGGWTALTTSNQALASNIAASGTQNLDLRLTAPSSTSNFSQQSVDVTITATQH